MSEHPEYREGLGDKTGRLITHKHGWLEFRLAPAYTCEIVNIEVDNEHRRIGAGTEMLQELEQHEHVKTIYAFTRTTNLPAVKWYLANGFILSFIPFYYKREDTGHAYLCVKSLVPCGGT